MIVEQAIFGEVKGGHALRAASGNSAAAVELAPRLDLPDTAPPGVDWSPFVSGFPHRDRYVIARTFRDTKAARSGMVLSHALIVPIEEILVAPNLRPLFDLLIVDENPPSDLLTLDVDLRGEFPPASVELPAAAAVLATRASGPLVRLGHQGFDELVVSLWYGLWPAVRRNFAFRLSFGPGDLIETPPPILVCTPPGLVARWRGHRLLDSSASPSNSLAAAMLSGDSEGHRLRAFADRIGAELSRFGDLPLLEQAYRLAVLEPDTIGNTVAGLRLAERLSPDPTRGEGGKGDLLNRLLLHFEHATADDVLPLRNISLRGFRQADRLWRELDHWVARNVFPEEQDSSFRLVIADATQESGATGDWRKAVLDGLAGAARAQGKAFASAFWRWAEADPTIVRPIWTVIEANKELEGRFVQVAPAKLSREAARPILELACQERLHLLHGAAASAAFNPLDAVRLQLKVEAPPAANGIRLALGNAKPRELVACAVDVADPRVVQLAAEAVAKKPTLLAAVDMLGEAARAIWSAALTCDLDTWCGPADPRAAFDAILVDLLDRRLVPVQLVDLLSRTPLADLADFARRIELWSMLTGATRDNLVRATARGGCEKTAAGAPATELETDLQAAVLNDIKLDELLNQFAVGRIDAAIQVVAALPSFDEHRFRTWLRNAFDRTRPILPGYSEAIGQLTQERRWRFVADDLMHMLHLGREDVRPALRACVSMIGLWNRWMYGLSAITYSEKWESFESLAADLYATGPDHDGLWERAGGHNADLNWNGNGRARWRDALTHVRRGGKAPRIDGLLREMQLDYPANASVRFLADDYEFGGRR